MQLVHALGEHLAGGTVDDLAPLAVDDEHPVDEVERGVEVVLDQHDGMVAVGDEVGEGSVDLVDADGIEVGGRLVEHDDRGAERERAGDRQPLAPTAGEHVGVLVAALPQADPAQRPFGAIEYLGRGHEQVLGAESDLVEQGAGHDLRVGILEDHADGRTQRADRRVAGVGSGDEHSAGQGRGHRVGNEPVEREGEGRLARSAGAEHEQDLAGRDRERDAVGGGARGVLVRDPHVRGAQRCARHRVVLRS